MQSRDVRQGTHSVAKILFLTQILPYPLDAGAKVRAYYVLRYLARQHEVTLVSFVREDDPPEAVAHLARICKQVYTAPMTRTPWRTAAAGMTGWLTGQPAVIVRDRSRAMFARLRAVVEAQAFTSIHADQTAMVQYAEYAQRCAVACGQPRPRLVLDAHNALFKVVARLANQAENPLKRRVLEGEAARLQAYEEATYGRFDDVIFVTEADRAEFALAHASVIPICREPEPSLPDAPTVRPRCTFVGALHWPPNAEGVRWFAHKVWPEISRQVPNATLTVIGKHPPADLTEAGLQHAEVLGYVADLAPYLAETGVFVVPLLSGGGMRVKIIDAWMWGLPVVSTRIGAEGVEGEDGRNLLLADTPDEFAHAVVTVMQEKALNQQLRQSGRQTVSERYRWQTVYRAWDAVHPC